MAKIKSFSARYNGKFTDISFSTNSSLSISALTGSNGSSKSSILRDIVVCSINSEKKKTPEGGSEFNKNRQEESEITALFTEGKSIHVVAASGSPSDRFPEKNRGGRPSIYDVPNYVYLGQRIGTNLLSKKPIIELIIANLLKSGSQFFFSEISEYIFKTVGLLPQIHVEIRPRLSQKKREQRNLLDAIVQTINAGDGSKHEGYLSSKHGVEMLKSIMEEYNYDSFLDFEEFKKKKSGRAKLLLPFSNSTPTDFNPEAIALGLSTGELEVADCKVISYTCGNPYSIYELSSGEYHFLTSMLGLYLTTQAGSIVMIDEPENSLHPAWQNVFIDVLCKICQERLVDQLIIGTHSPVIISSLTDEAEVIDLSNGENSRSYYAKSVDEILLENFKLPTTRNHYFYDELQDAINLFADNQSESKCFKEIIKRLVSYRRNMRSSDPAAEIIDFLQAGRDVK